MEWRNLFAENVLKSSQQYIKKGSVANVKDNGNNITGDVTGIDDFHVKIDYVDGNISYMTCSCPLAQTGANCKHMAAVLCFWDTEVQSKVDEKTNDTSQNSSLTSNQSNTNTLQDEHISEKKLIEEENDHISDNEAKIEVKELIKASELENDNGKDQIREEINKQSNEPITEDVYKIDKPEEQEKRNVTYSSNWQYRPEHHDEIIMKADVNPVFAFALYQNGTPLVKDVTITNNSEKEYKNLVIRVYSDFYFFDMNPINIGTLKPNETTVIDGLSFQIQGNALKKLSEKITCNIFVCLTYSDEEWARYGSEINVLAINQWPGVDYDNVLLASFVMPNNPIISNLLYYASEYLEKNTGIGALDAYQSGDPNRVLEMATAAYASIQKKNIKYATAPSGFVHDGQKIRFVDEMMSLHMGNCMDMSLLYVACLEQMGLNPLLVLTAGHIFSGVWLVDDIFPDSFTLDPSKVDKQIELGKLIVVESTAMCSGQNISFDDAMKSAKLTLANYAEIEGVLDIRRARRGNVKPMPLEKRDVHVELEHKELNDDELTGLSDKETKAVSFDDLEKEKMTKQLQWEHKLLDLGTRNPLINLSKKVIPLLAGELGELEDAFSENKEYKICSIPEEWTIRGADSILLPEFRADLGEYVDLIREETKSKRLHTIIKEDKLDKEITRVYRATKDSMAESGANTLYLTLGELRWTEGKTANSKFYYAPIVLIPIEIIRKSANEGYVIKGTDEETQVNVTLIEFLKQKFSLDISGLNQDLPKDEHGVDIDKIFDYFTHAISNKPNWLVLKNAYIGNFSFSQFVMWNDIHSHPEMLRRNKVVEALLDGEVEWNTYLPSIEQKDAPYLPVSVDESQLRAVNMAVNDVSFVLHGPPGAGKSQTITAMIANALTRGKTVLFVAEKPAALEVVENRLNQIGIGDFCVRIHSNKIKKSEVLEQFKRVKDNYRVLGLKTDYDDKMTEIISLREELNEYGITLHKKRKFGLSVKELIDEYESLPEISERLHFDKDYIENITQKDIDRSSLLLEHMVAAGKVLGHPSDSSFQNVGQTEYSMLLREQIEDAAYAYKKEIDKFESAVTAFCNSACEAMPKSKLEWISTIGFADAIIKAKEIPEYLLKPNVLEESKQALINFVKNRDNYKQYSLSFFNRYNESILNVDFNEYSNKFSEASKKIFGKDKAIETVSAELGVHTKFLPKQDQLSSIESDVEKYKSILSDYEESKNAVPEFWIELVSDDTTEESVNNTLSEWSEKLSSLEAYTLKISSLKNAGVLDSSIPVAKELFEEQAVFKEKEEALMKLLVMDVPERVDDYLQGKKDIVTLVKENTSELRDWIIFQGCRKDCIDAGLDEICDLYVKGLKHELVVPVFLKSVYKALLWMVLEDKPVLNKFNGNMFNEKIREYSKKEDELIELTKQEMIYKLSHNIPSGHEDHQMYSELKILNKAITSGGRGMSIRELFDKAPNVIRKMCPCFLMSPLSVAQFISADSDLFDLVIFDEASQIRTCEAVGTLCRGKNAIIVGDPNQMPPTSFFMGDSYDEENEEIEDLDSILDDCLALGMPETHLQWHYRSRHESLIAFSNMEYYENNMLTFPSISDRERRVKLCTINGVFLTGKDRTNEKEAKAIVEEVLRRYQSDNLRKYSIGIVTFNEPQRKLIETLLNDEAKKDVELDKWMNESKEPLIVRNLENVQGDERDIILFSVTYGMDEERRWRQDFGPLNREGGWRRLNVAVSRAKEEMIVFSSITPDMISDSSSRGVQGIKDFLIFAGQGRLVGSSTSDESKPKGIVKVLCDVLEKEGYYVQRNIGHSNFKIDIAVVNPYDQNEYLLGIMLDGDTYKASQNNAKDREISQMDILKGLGWSLHRIWTMDWWDNKEAEVKKLLAVLEKRKEEAKVATESEKDFDYCPPSEQLDPLNTTKKEKKQGEDKEKKKRYVLVTGMDSTNRFIKKTPIALLIENRIVEAPQGDFFKVLNGDPIPVVSMAYDNFVVYEVVNNTGEEYLFLIDDKKYKAYAKKYFQDDIALEDSFVFNEIYPDIEAKAFEKAFRDSIDEGSEKKRFKTIRNTLEHFNIAVESDVQQTD